MKTDPIEGDILLREGQAVKAIKTVTQEVRNMKRTNDQVMAEAGSSGARGFLKKLKGELGEESVFGQFGKLAMGGGAIAGVTMLGRALATSTKEMGELIQGFKKGELTAGEFTESLVGALPIFGSFWQAGRNIREMLTGEAEAIRLINEEAKLTNTYFDDQWQRVKFLRDTMKGYTDEIARAKSLTAIINAQSPLEATVRGIRQNQEDYWAGWSKDLDNAIETARGKAKKLADDEKAQIESLKQQYKNQYGIGVGEKPTLNWNGGKAWGIGAEKVNQGMTEDLSVIGG